MSDTTFESCSVGVYATNVGEHYGVEWAHYCGPNWGSTCWVYPGQEGTDAWSCSLDWLGTEGYTPDNPSEVPQCTDAIADAGGICIGEPVSEGPPATTTATLAETGPAPWLTPDVGIGIAVILVVGVVLARRGWAQR